MLQGSCIFSITPNVNIHLSLHLLFFIPYHPHEICKLSFDQQGKPLLLFMHFQQMQILRKCGLKGWFFKNYVNNCFHSNIVDWAALAQHYFIILLQWGDHTVFVKVHLAVGWWSMIRLSKLIPALIKYLHISFFVLHKLSHFSIKTLPLYKCKSYAYPSAFTIWYLYHISALIECKPKVCPGFWLSFISNMSQMFNILFNC